MRHSIQKQEPKRFLLRLISVFVVVTLQSNRIDDQRAELPPLRPDSRYIPPLAIEKIEVSHEAEEVSNL